MRQALFNSLNMQTEFCWQFPQIPLSLHPLLSELKQFEKRKHEDFESALCLSNQVILNLQNKLQRLVFFFICGEFFFLLFNIIISSNTFNT